MPSSNISIAIYLSIPGVMDVGMDITPVARRGKNVTVGPIGAILESSAYYTNGRAHREPKSLRKLRVFRPSVSLRYLS